MSTHGDHTSIRDLRKYYKIFKRNRQWQAEMKRFV